MRIVGGRLSGRRLASLGGGAPEARLRPTSDRVRESLFNILEHGLDFSFEGARVLDLFAGTGALGLEALSRGAARCVFIEENATARALIRENVETLSLIGETKIFRRDATRLGPSRGEPYDLIFADPPYRQGVGAKALASAREGGWIAPDAVVMLEESAAEETPEGEGWRRLDARRYGETQVIFLSAQPAS